MDVGCLCRGFFGCYPSQRAARDARLDGFNPTEKSIVTSSLISRHLCSLACPKDTDTRSWCDAGRTWSDPLTLASRRQLTGDSEESLLLTPGNRHTPSPRVHPPSSFLFHTAPGNRHSLDPSFFRILAQTPSFPIFARISWSGSLSQLGELAPSNTLPRIIGVRRPRTGDLHQFWPARSTLVAQMPTGRCQNQLHLVNLHLVRVSPAVCLTQPC
jgi:hypothetical protein